MEGGGKATEPRTGKGKAKAKAKEQEEAGSDRRFRRRLARTR